MSDSDSDNGYTDYLESRRAAVLKKKKSSEPVKKYADSDDSDDDDFAFSTRASEAKRKRSDFEDEVEEVSLVEDTHNQRLKSQLDSMEEEYKRNVFKDGASIIPCTSGKMSSVLSKTIRVCETLNGVTSGGQEEDEDCIVEEEGEEEVTKEKQKEEKTREDSLGADMFPVTIQILDCELTKQSQRHEIQLDSSFQQVLREYASSWKCHINQIVLTFNGTIVDGASTPKDLGFRALQIPYPRMEVFKRDAGNEAEVITVTEGPSDGISVKAQLKNRKKPIHLKLRGETTIQEIKEMIVTQLEEENEAEIPDVDAMRIMFDDEYLTELDATCQDIGFEDEDCIDIYV